jgi:transcriptional regulator with XRE-family HTH domain
MISKTIAQKIKERREELNLAPKQVASELGISARAYLDMEEGTVDFKSTKLVVLKKVLNISIAEMFNETAQHYNVYNQSPQEGNVGIIYTYKEALDKICELYERVVELEKSKR